MNHDRSRFFVASCVALLVTAMSFALRGGAMSAWTTEFNLSHTEIGWVTGTAFWGFTLAMLFGGPLCDLLGLGRIVGVAFIGHLAGTLLTIFAWDFWSLYFGTLLFGISNGSVEAACNPLIATLYKENKTTKLNNFHVWFPGGIMIGAVLAYFLAKMGYGWRIQFGMLLVPTVAYGLMFRGLRFPVTERVASGISTGAMWKACLNPLFLLMVICMLLTASTELGPGQWIPTILENAGVAGILVLAWINGLMAAGRMFAGTFVHRLSPIGMLIMSAVFSCIGLLLLSHTSGALIFVAATVFAVGVCFFWPTMLGFVNERFPRTGALGLAIMGGAGMLSVSFVLPVIGKFYDNGISANLPSGETVEALAAAAPGTEMASTWMKVQAAAGLEALGTIAWLPAILVVIFLLIRLLDRKSHAGAVQIGDDRE